MIRKSVPLVGASRCDQFDSKAHSRQPCSVTTRLAFSDPAEQLYNATHSHAQAFLHMRCFYADSLSQPYSGNASKSGLQSLQDLACFGCFAVTDIQQGLKGAITMVGRRCARATDLKR